MEKLFSQNEMDIIWFLSANKILKWYVFNSVWLKIALLLTSYVFMNSFDFIALYHNKNL